MWLLSYKNPLTLGFITGSNLKVTLGVKKKTSPQTPEVCSGCFLLTQSWWIQSSTLRSACSTNLTSAHRVKNFTHSDSTLFFIHTKFYLTGIPKKTCEINFFLYDFGLKIMVRKFLCRLRPVLISLALFCVRRHKVTKIWTVSNDVIHTVKGTISYFLLIESEAERTKTMYIWWNIFIISSLLQSLFIDKVLICDKKKSNVQTKHDKRCTSDQSRVRLHGIN